ncbi:MAG: glycosyltransferase [Phycisphaerae bacterium]|nr:glycosyltransferase [Phycisphaerae bacterium]
MSVATKRNAPRFSIVTPVHNPPRNAFEECIQSVFSQTAEDWEWCLVDDCSPKPWVKERLLQLQAHDPRIRVFLREKNCGIVAASNDALSMAEGDFVAFLDNDDVLHGHALAKVDEVLRSNSMIDYVYTDEDKIDETGRHYDEFRKPKWSPQRFLSQNYCSHLSVIRRTLINEVGRFRTGFDGSQDYDLLLRVIERARVVAHLPEVLYHWRAIAGSTARAHDEKPYAFNAAMRAVQESLARQGIDAAVEKAEPYPFQRVVRRLQNFPKISIIIPTCGAHRPVFGVDTCLVVNAVESILSRSTYPNFEILVLIDDHSPEEAWSSLRAIDDRRVRLVPYDEPFNYSAKCNLGVVMSDGEYVLLLNDDTEIIDDDWMEVLASYLVEPDVAMVGPMLLLEDGRIQSAGHSNTPIPHNFRTGQSANGPGEFGILAVARECSGVTGACALVRRSAYEATGGMSLIFPKAFNDVDFAFKLLDAGHRIIWTPCTRLFHFETASRPKEVESSEVELLHLRWQRKFDRDEYCRLV